MNKISQQLTFKENSPVAHYNKHGKKLPYGIYECSCGRTVEKWKPDVTRNKVKSCNSCNGHRMTSTRFYRIWKAMKTRTLNNNYAEYHLYGGRGIKLSEDWIEFENFKKDMHESYLQHCKRFGILNTQIDRINSDGDYTITNCRWATKSEQANNKRLTIMVSYRGGIATIREIATAEKKHYSTIYERYIKGKYERIIQ